MNPLNTWKDELEAACFLLSKKLYRQCGQSTFLGNQVKKTRFSVTKTFDGALQNELHFIAFECLMYFFEAGKKSLNFFNLLHYYSTREK